MRNTPPTGQREDSREPQGQTIPAQGDQQQRAPRSPHESDESADSQQGGEASGRRIGKIAHDDVERGAVDTDKGPAMDATYERVRQGTPDPGKKFSP